MLSLCVAIFFWGGCHAVTLRSMSSMIVRNGGDPQEKLCVCQLLHAGDKVPIPRDSITRSRPPLRHTDQLESQEPGSWSFSLPG